MAFYDKYLKYKQKYLELKGRAHVFSKLVTPPTIPPITPSDGPILPGDILFQDFDVCILKPNVKKGILIFTNYQQPVGAPSLCESGLKTGAKLQSEGVNFGRTMIHNYIFFRAPYFTGPIDYESIDAEIESSFGESQSEISSRVWIRVDPAKTFVYSSEIRAKYSPEYSPQVRYGTPMYISQMETEVHKSRKSMIDYLRILDENETSLKQIQPGQKPFYNLFSSKVGLFPMAYNLSYPWNENNINRQSEVLVRIPHLTVDYFVKCS